MNNGPEGKNTQEICIDEKETPPVPLSPSLLPPPRRLLLPFLSKKKRTRSVDIDKTCSTVAVVVVIVVLFLLPPSPMYYPYKHIDTIVMRDLPFFFPYV